MLHTSSLCLPWPHGSRTMIRQVCVGCNTITTVADCVTAPNCVWSSANGGCEYVNMTDATSPAVDGVGVRCSAQEPTAVPTQAPTGPPAVGQSTEPTSAPTQAPSQSVVGAPTAATLSPSPSGPPTVPATFTIDGRIDPITGIDNSVNTWIPLTIRAEWFVALLAAIASAVWHTSHAQPQSTDMLVSIIQCFLFLCVFHIDGFVCLKEALNSGHLVRCFNRVAV